MPRIGKFHLGIKSTKVYNKGTPNEKTVEYPTATDYFVFPKEGEAGFDLVPQLTKAFGEKPKSLRIAFAAEHAEDVAPQFYKCYTRTRGLVCRGDGEVCERMVDVKTGGLPGKDSVDVEWREDLTCEGRECPYYQDKKIGCREMMNLQFLLPEISGMGVWQVDSGSINSIRNINSCLSMIRLVYGRIAMVPLVLSIEQVEVTPPGEKKKKVNVLNIRSNDSLQDMAIKAKANPIDLFLSPEQKARMLTQAKKDMNELWEDDAVVEQQEKAEEAGRMTPEEIENAREIDEESMPEDVEIFEPGPEDIEQPRNESVITPAHLNELTARPGGLFEKMGWTGQELAQFCKDQNRMSGTKDWRIKSAAELKEWQYVMLRDTIRKTLGL